MRKTIRIPLINFTLITWLLLAYLFLATLPNGRNAFLDTGRKIAATASRRLLLIAPSGEMGSNEVEAFHNACQIWNTLVGRPVFIIPTGSDQQPDVWLTRVYSYEERGTLAVTYYQYNKILVSYLEVLKFNRPLLEKVLIHELGHVLGLGHSDDKDSVMYPSVGKPFLPNQEEIAKVKTDWNQEF
jgi:hypothetical protein